MQLLINKSAKKPTICVNTLTDSILKLCKPDKTNTKNYYRSDELRLIASSQWQTNRIEKYGLVLFNQLFIY